MRCTTESDPRGMRPRASRVARFFGAAGLSFLLTVAAASESRAQGGGKPPKPDKPKPGKPVVPDPPPDPGNDGKAPKPDAPDKPPKPEEPGRFPGLSRHGERLDERDFGKRPETPALPLAEDRRLKWGLRLDGAVRAAAIHDGRNVYACTETGSLGAFALADGSRIWNSELGSGVSARPVLLDGKWLAPLKNGQIVAVDCGSGMVRNSTRVTGPVEVAFAVDPAGKRIVVSTAAGELLTLDAQTFAVTARFPGIPGLRLGSPTIAGDRAWVVDARGMVRAVELATGRAIWELQLFGSVTTPILHVPGATPLVVVGTAGGELFAVDATAGKEVWKARGYSAYVGACIRGGEILAAFSNRRLFRFDTRTGRVVEDRTLRDVPHAAPFIVGNTLLLPCLGGRIVTFDSGFRELDPLLLGSELLEAGPGTSVNLLTTEAGDLYRFEES